MEIDQLLEVAGSVVATLVLETRFPPSGKTAERQHLAATFEFREGKVWNWTPHPSRDRAFEAMGVAG